MELLASGRDAEVFTYADGLVLRRYRDGRPAGAEAELMRSLTDAGYPVPAVHRVTGPDLVMSRVHGPTLAAAMLEERIAVEDGARMLADLHDRLHAIAMPRGVALLHLDLHPLNVLLGETGPVVIDWSNARPGPAGLDVAMTAVILAQVAVVPGMLPEKPELEAAMRAQSAPFLSVFLAAAADPPDDHLEAAVDLRRHDPYQSAAELAGLGDAAEMVRSLLP
jgi:aminoglycoside phosphotransferase (APT) family kinase protein